MYDVTIPEEGLSRVLLKVQDVLGKERIPTIIEINIIIIKKIASSIN